MIIDDNDGVQDDNIEAAMDAVASSAAPTRKKSTGAKSGEQAQSQILIRATPEDHELIKRAAAHEGISMSEFVRRVAVQKASESVECQHPQNLRKRYPWADFCLKCGARVAERSDNISYKIARRKKPPKIK